MPKFEFCLPTNGKAVPDGPDWFHEIRFDGYRLRVERDAGRVRLITKGGYDWTKRFPRIVEAALRNRQQRFTDVKEMFAQMRKAKRYSWNFALVLLLASPAAAGWETKNVIDRFTEKKTFYAELPAKEGDAILFVGCSYGELYPDVHFPSRIGQGEIEVIYQFDEDPVVSRATNISPEGNALWLWLISGREIAQTIRESKRLQMEEGDRSIEFDLSGADRALAPIHCK